MRCSAVVTAPDGTDVTLGHGDFIGRLWHAAIVVDDPRISEAHAMVSLRGHELVLLALRGRFAVDGVPVERAVLRPGLSVSLAQGLAIVVQSVHMPDAVLGIAIDDGAPRVLPGTSALVAHPRPGLATAAHPEALGWVWAVPEGWRLRRQGHATEPLEDGHTWSLGGHAWRAVAVPIRSEGAPTVRDPGHGGSLRVVARYDVVHLHRPGRVPLVVGGQAGRIISELVAFGCPVPWTTLAQALWPGGYTRKQFDMALVRVRRKLRDAGVRADLVRTDGAGAVEVFLHPGDVALDQA